MTLTESQLKQIPVFGIAGNFAEHLSQAGEASDFIDVKTEDQNAPKGMFPIYIPGSQTFLGVYPLCTQTIQADFSKPIYLQVEPEISVLFEVSYDEKQAVKGLSALAFSAFNDCSNRSSAPKISQKKNWGKASTGVSNQWIEIDQFSSGGVLDGYYLSCFLKRDDEVIEYGVDSAAMGYNYFYQTLSDWIKLTLNTQEDFGPLENLKGLLQQAHFPKQIIVTLGATRYTAFGESGYLKPGDQIGVFVYQPAKTCLADIKKRLQQNSDFSDFNGSALVQTVKTLS